MKQIVPFANLQLQYNGLREEIDAAMNSVINKGAFIGGNSNRFVLDLERNFSSYIGTKYGIGCANGTDALEMVLQYLNLSPKDEVIVPALSWYSSVEAVVTSNAKVKFVDINESYTIDVDKLEETITKSTKVIIVVHLYGNAADMTRINEISKKYNLFVLEDCAQSHGAEHRGIRVGTFGDASTFSFYPGKNLGAFGDAGMILTNDAKIEEFVRKARNHGQKEKHNHFFSGRNSRLDGIQAAVVNVKLSYLDKWNKRRLDLAKLYNKKLAQLSYIKCPSISMTDLQVFHLYVIRTKYRDQLSQFLEEKGVATGIHYPYPLPSLPPFSEQNMSIYPKVDRYSKEILSIPIFPELTDEQLDYVCELIEKFGEKNLIN